MVELPWTTATIDSVEPSELVVCVVNVDGEDVWSGLDV